MSKETQKIYKKMIDEATSKIVVGITSTAFEITNEVRRDIMVSVRDALNDILNDERKDGD